MKCVLGVARFVSGSLANVIAQVGPVEEAALSNVAVQVLWALSYLKAEHEEWYADGSYGGPWRREVDAALGEAEKTCVATEEVCLQFEKGAAAAGGRKKRQTLGEEESDEEEDVQLKFRVNTEIHTQRFHEPWDR